VSQGVCNPRLHSGLPSPNPKSQDCRCQRHSDPSKAQLRFPHIIDLHLYSFRDYRGCNPLVIVFKHMSGLEKLTILLSSETRHDGRTMHITTIASTDLKYLHISGPMPRGLISTIVKHCPHLTNAASRKNTESMTKISANFNCHVRIFSK